jgi:hypothetical protein
MYYLFLFNKLVLQISSPSEQRGQPDALLSAISPHRAVSSHAAAPQAQVARLSSVALAQAYAGHYANNNTPLSLHTIFHLAKSGHFIISQEEICG